MAEPPAVSCTSTCAAIPGGRRSRPAARAARTAGTSRASRPGADGHRERHHGAALHASTRTPTRGTRCSLWRKDGTLYTLSEHVAPPLTFNHVVRYLKQELASLVLDPARSLMKLTRRQFVVGTAAGAVGAAGHLRARRPAHRRLAAARRGGGEAARAASARRRPRRALGRGRGARAAAAPPRS